MQVTHIFRDVLHGWGQILLSVNISPDAADYDETAHVLKVGILSSPVSTRQHLQRFLLVTTQIPNFNLYSGRSSTITAWAVMRCSMKAVAKQLWSGWTALLW